MTSPGEAGLGWFVTFEGVEGSGKTTQIRRLADRIRGGDREVVVTREPGGTELGSRLRSVLLREGEAPISPLAELFLYVADRAQHLAQIVEPALRRGAIVLCDRYLDATVAYQGYGRALGRDAVLDLHRLPPLTRRPDRTILLDLDAAEGLARARHRNRSSDLESREGRFEAETLRFHRAVRDGYLALAAADAGRVRVVPAAGSEEEVEARVIAAVADLGLVPFAGGR